MWMNTALKKFALPLCLLPLAGCKVGGSVNSASKGSEPTANVAVPTIASPLTTPYYSNGSSLTISGLCAVGSSVMIAGDMISSKQCTGTSYSFTVNKSTDGVYSFLINQSVGGAV